MRGWWKLVGLGLLVAGPQCSTAPPCSNHSAPHATFAVTEGCAGYYCGMTCDPGFLDCNNDEVDGCETPASVGCTRLVEASVDVTNDVADGSTAPTLLRPLIRPPSGLAVCNGSYVFFDGPDLSALNASTLLVSTVASTASLGTPADGIACDNAYAYWAVPSDSDASLPNGAVYRAQLVGDPSPTAVATDVEPLSGIERDGANLFVMTTSGVALWDDGDAGLITWSPASLTGAYKPFVLGSAGLWSIEGPSVYLRQADAGDASVWLADAGAPMALAMQSGAPVLAEGTALATLEDDAGNASLSPFASVAPIIATGTGTPLVVASDSTIYVVAGGTAKVAYTTTEHVVDVATDGVWIIWTTRGNLESPAVWRGVLP